ncbi:MAG: hypothetical protein M1821_002683 [Bathelium mastoideum]|nr:MAG: hypothetical protein M1821_002683 [Bathelium mastoideum]
MVCGFSSPYSCRRRTTFNYTYATVYAHPSRSGVVVLSPAYVADFTFLGLDPLNPPRQNYLAPVTPIEAKTPITWGQEAEDDFARRLLLLGAKWYDSEARFNILTEWENIAYGEGGENQLKPYGEIRVDSGWRLSEQPRPTMREKRRISVGWPSDGSGVWVAEYDTGWGGCDEDNLEPPAEPGQEPAEWGELSLATTMDERCKLLKERFGAKFFADVCDYKGYGFLNAWDWESTKQGEGEVGKLLSFGETVHAWRASLEYKAP